jgi:sugar O-acyltransferase (sialic acid O-acetyltransferase NeuD family)
MKKDIAIYGAGGFGREVACMIAAINEVQPEWNFIGFFDDGLVKGTKNIFGEIIGGIDDLNSWNKELNVVFSIATPHILKKVVGKIANSNIKFPNLVAPNVNFLHKESLQIGQGNLLFFGTRVSCEVTIGDFNLLNGFVSLGHDVQIGSFNVLGPMVRLSGNVTIQDENFFGVQSIVLQGLKMGYKTKVGANSVIIRNTKDETLYMGNPATRIKI